ncbi:MAG: glutathione S-transferase N-terminal domain-containing protein [Solirubrobacteraceae bacterium]
MPTITLHALPPSHPCLTAEAALKLKDVDYERVDFQPGTHVEEMRKIYGEGFTTVPGAVFDGEPVHGSRAILARLEEIAPSPSLYPDPIADAVREAERWGDDEFQDLGRRLPFGAMHFRPEALGTFGGASPLDPAGTDFAIAYVRGSWKYHKITAARLAEDLAGLPAKIDHIEGLANDGIIDGAEPTAADLQIAATCRVLLCVGDLRPLLEGRAAERIGQRFFPEYSGDVPAGAYPAGWIPDAA